MKKRSEIINNMKEAASILIEDYKDEGMPQSIDISRLSQKDLALFRMIIADYGYASVVKGDMLWLGTEEERIKTYITLVDLIAF